MLLTLKLMVRSLIMGLMATLEYSDASKGFGSPNRGFDVEASSTVDSSGSGTGTWTSMNSITESFFVGVEGLT